MSMINPLHQRGHKHLLHWKQRSSISRFPRDCHAGIHTCPILDIVSVHTIDIKCLTLIPKIPCWHPFQLTSALIYNQSISQIHTTDLVSEGYTMTKCRCQIGKDPCQANPNKKKARHKTVLVQLLTDKIAKVVAAQFFCVWAHSCYS